MMNKQYPDLPSEENELFSKAEEKIGISSQPDDNIRYLWEYTGECPKCGADIFQHYDKKGHTDEAACSKCEWTFKRTGA